MLNEDMCSINILLNKILDIEKYIRNPFRKQGSHITLFQGTPLYFVLYEWHPLELYTGIALPSNIFSETTIPVFP